MSNCCSGSSYQNSNVYPSTFIRNFCNPITNLLVNFVFANEAENFEILLERNKVYQVSYVNTSGLYTVVGKLVECYKYYTVPDNDYNCPSNSELIQDSYYKIKLDCSETNTTNVVTVAVSSIRFIKLYNDTPIKVSLLIPNGTTSNGLTVGGQCVNLTLTNVIVDGNNKISNAIIAGGEITGGVTTGGTTIGINEDGVDIIVIDGTGSGKVTHGTIIGATLVSGEIQEDFNITNAVLSDIVVQNSTTIGEHIEGTLIPNTITNITISNGTITGGATTGGVTVNDVTTGGVTVGGTITGGVITGYIGTIPITIEGVVSGNLITEGGSTTGGSITGGETVGNVTIGATITGGTTIGGETIGDGVFVTYVIKGHPPRPIVGDYDFTNLSSEDVIFPPDPIEHTNLEIYTGDTDKSSNLSEVKIY